MSTTNHFISLSHGETVNENRLSELRRPRTEKIHTIMSAEHKDDLEIGQRRDT